MVRGDFPDLLIYMVAIYDVFILKVLLPLIASTTHHTSHADYADFNGLNPNTLEFKYFSLANISYYTVVVNGIARE